MQISAAERALRLPPDGKILRDSIFALMADIHKSTIKAMH